jgi:hypothetical protein
MKTKLTTTLLSIILLILSFAFKPSAVVNPISIYNSVYAVEDLDNQDLFSFSVIGDNHGASPYDNIQMASSVNCARFGNHNSFL